MLNKVVTGLTIEYEGWGYTSVPIMTIEQPELGTQATAVAIMTSRTGVPNQSVDRILITNPGFGYTDHQSNYLLVVIQHLLRLLLL